MSSLSIIIPATRGDAGWEFTLASVLQHRPPGAEVIVAVPGKYDDPYQLQDEVRFIQLARRASPLDCLQAGCRAAGGEVVHLLGAGVEVEENWVDTIIPHFDDPRVAAAVPAVFDTHGAATCGVAVVAGDRRLVGRDAVDAPARLPLGPELRAAFYRKAALLEIGGLPDCVGPALADIDVAISLQAAGYRTVVEPRSQLRAGDDFVPLRGGSFKSGFYAERFFWRSKAKIGLAVRLFRPLGALRACLAARSVGGAGLNLLGRGAAWTRLGSDRKHRERLRNLARRAEPLRPAGAAILRSGETLRFDAGHQQPDAAPARNSEPARR